MKKLNRRMLLLALCATVLAVAGVTIAQRAAPRGGEALSVRIVPGEEILLHDSYDTVIEIYIDLPSTDRVRIKYHDPGTETTFPLPNATWIRAQGRVLLSHDPEPKGPSAPIIRYRYADTMFCSFSREPRR